MSESEKNEKRSFRFYVLFEEGHRVLPEGVKILVDSITKNAVLEDFGTGNAYNMPDYLLDVIEGHEDNAMVVAWDYEGETPHPRVLTAPSEICPLIEALKANPNADAWKIVVDVNKKIRAAQEAKAAQAAEETENGEDVLSPTEQEDEK